ncbi:MAG TPA: hypothetical protein VF941_00195 [Clostridia bacterium]
MQRKIVKQYGKVKVTILPPDITKEENLRRLKEMEKDLSRIMGAKITLIPRCDWDKENLST